MLIYQSGSSRKMKLPPTIKVFIDIKCMIKKNKNKTKHNRQTSGERINLVLMVQTQTPGVYEELPC